MSGSFLLMVHRYNIATGLTERAKNEGELAQAGILVWLRFMATRQLTWNKNYNVKPRWVERSCFYYMVPLNTS
jgi:alpha-glucan,water dikinase